MEGRNGIDAALARAWHQASAKASLERWLEVCQKEGWGDVPANLPLLLDVFGASWYFTRYIFYRGREAALLLDNIPVQDLRLEYFNAKFSRIHELDGPEHQLERLRLLKNEAMLQILAAFLTGWLNQEQSEVALTQLAYASLTTVLQIFELNSRPGSRLAVYGMGRMAGAEMTFGSDLDLIFVFDNTSIEENHLVARKVRMLLRHIATAGSAGSLYEVDMRLRPHGTSGALLTPASAFLQYHQSPCEVWERQMMTRCTAVVDPHGLGHECLDRVRPYIYADYDHQFLRREIVAMRHRVQDEKGNIGGKFEVKRGPGGIMDIDFLTHYFQLCHGHTIPELQTCSTRTALRVLAGKRLIATDVASELLRAYDFLKRIEAAIRLFDMKPVSSFSTRTAEHLPVAAAMGYTRESAGGFAEKYKDITAYVRGQFRMLLGDPAQTAAT